MIEELNGKYTEFKGVIDILPVNTKYNRKRKIDYILDEEKNDQERLLVVKKEIESRISKFNNLEVNNDIQKLEEQLEKCNICNEWNTYNTAYEKMHLDYYLYQLHKYYKDNLDGVNACIKKIIEVFNKVGINLTKDDFDFNEYVAIYMDKIINNANDDELKECFEEIYWKNSDIIKTIEINLKSIYYRNEKKINKYYEDRHNEYLKSHNDNEIYDLRVKLSKDIINLKGMDAYLNFEKFKNGKYAINDFKENDIEKKKEIYFNQESYSYDNLTELYDVLNEYNVLIKYKYLFDDMKDKLGKKEEFKNAKSNALKQVFDEENKLKKLNAKKNKKSLFGGKKSDDKYIFQYKELLNGILKQYDELDQVCFNDLVYVNLNQDSKIIEVLKLITANYLYFVDKTLALDEGRNINDINDSFEKLKSFVYDKKFMLLNNIALLDEKQMKQLIVDRYNLGDIKLTTDSLMDGNLEKTINDIKGLINYEDIVNSGIDLDDLSLYLDYNKLLEKEKAK